MNDNNNNGNDGDDDNNNNNNNNEQQHLLTRLPQYALKRRRRNQHPNTKKKSRKKQKQEQYAPKFPIGTKISITDSVLYRTYDHKIDIRLDGTIEGYERVHFNTANADDDDDEDDDDIVIDKYAWHYVVRFIDHEHLFEDQDQESDDDDDDDNDDDDDEEEENDNENEEVAGDGDGDDNDEKARKDKAQAIQRAVARAEVYNSIAGVNVNVKGPPRPPSSDDATSFVKVMPEQDIADSLSRDDVSYIIDQYFGRNLRELLQVRYTSGTVSDHSSTVLREYRNSLSRPIPTMNWTLFFQEVKMCPNMARARFPLYDSTGDTIGDFTVLAMAVIVLLLQRSGEQDDDDDEATTNRKDPSPLLTLEKEPHTHNGDDATKELDEVTIIAKLLEVYPKGIQQGIYHNRNRQLAGGSKYLGILQFIMEFDTHEDHYQRYQQYQQRQWIRRQQDDGNDGERVIAKKNDPQPRHELPHYFATLIHPDILKLFITSPVMNKYGQYLSTEFCPSFQKPMPLHRMMYSAWVTHRIQPPRRRTKRQHITTTTRHDSKIHSIDDWLSRSCTCNKVKVPVNPFLIDDSILSPQVKMILQNNWQAVTFLLCEQIVGTMNYSRTVLNYLLYDCIQNSESTNTKKNDEDDTTTTTNTNTVEAIFGGYIHKGGGGIVKWFNANNNAARKQNGGRRMTRLHVPNSFIALLFKYITPYNQAVFHSCLQLYVHQQRQLLPVPPMVSIVSTTIPTTTTISTVTTTTPSMTTTPGTESESDIDTPTPPTKDIHENTNATKLLACVLDALAIVQRNMVALPYQPLSNSRKGTTTTTTTTVPPQRSNDIIIKHCKIIGSMWKQYYQTFWTTTAATARHDSFSSTSLLKTLFSSSSSHDDSDCHDHPLYAAIRRNHPFRPIVQDVLNLDKSVLFDHSTPTTTTTTMSSSSSSLPPSSTSINILPPFAYAATKYCSQSLVEPVFVVPLSSSSRSSLDSTSTSTTTTTHDDDVNAIERIYELLRANPAAILSATRRTATSTATVSVTPPLGISSSAVATSSTTRIVAAAAVATATETAVIPTVTPSKQPPSIRSAVGGKVGHAVEGGGANRKRTTTTHNTTVTPDTKRMRMK